MSRTRAERWAAEQNRNEHTKDYFAYHAGRNRWQVRRREDGGRETTLIAE
ncbi:hypothetical protein ACFQ1E_08165 [Sphingomonas canadensis]|uniref:Uncharacterized protein n=1 Tax=Sphingomonas canadensis TaxID=1219257 RepID=A0ABW3H613_9SPHN|nr:hypothetical protein [Sphingomonas canadensis]MCW3836011.1 hypothetical protein [Sphingomonas canadensis]